MHMIERNFETKIRLVQLDRGKGFHFIFSILISISITHRKTCRCTTKQNGVMEARNKRVVERELAILMHLVLT